MKRVFKIAADLIFWIPFGFALFLSWQISKDGEIATPAFYSFLPMAFFYVGAAFIVLVGRIRRLERQVESQGGYVSVKPFSNEGTLFDDPTSWSLLAVGTGLRFWLMAAFFMIWPFVIAYMAIHEGWRVSTVCTALLLGYFQFLVLYALRRLTGDGVTHTDVA